MNFKLNRSFVSLAAATLTCLAGAAAHADDTEIFFNQKNNNVNANVLLILDTSGSMDDTISSWKPYEPTVQYPGSGGCDPGNYYYFPAGTSIGNLSCSSDNAVPKDQYQCARGAQALSGSSGVYLSDRYIRWGNVTTTSNKNGTTTVYAWYPSMPDLSSKSGKTTVSFTAGTDVECKADAGISGDGANTSLLYPTKYSSDSSKTGIWDTVDNSWWAVSGHAGKGYDFYTANYINYTNDPTQSITKTKMNAMQDAATALVNSISGINVGLMRYDYKGSGGMVLAPVAPISSNATTIQNAVNGWAPSGNTPLSETLFEGYRYMSGGDVDFGNNSYTTQCTATSTDSSGAAHCSSFSSSLQPSVAGSRTGNSLSSSQYNSPMDYSCQKNFIVFLTDGLPNGDYQADADIAKLAASVTPAASCYASMSAMYSALGIASTLPLPGGDGSGLCAEALAKYMNNTDMREDVADKQNIVTYLIGFDKQFQGDGSTGSSSDAFKYLQAVATAGGGVAFPATSYSELISALTQIISNVKKTNTTFTAPAVAVNAFNRTQTLNDLYVSVFSPKTSYHWPGNVKKYKVVNGVVVDVNGNPAVDQSTGFFKDLDGQKAQSYWSAAPDGADVTQGGAASHIPDPDQRKVYTYKGVNPSSPAALTPLTTGSVTIADLNIGGTDDPALVDLVNWTLGLDVQDENGDGSKTDTRHIMGDPVHTQPSVVIYGKNGDGTDDTVIFAPTNDGYFHAIDASHGAELWAFIPKEMLPFLKDLYANDDVNDKHYGIDGSVTVLKYDINGDGTIDASAGDRVLLFFGTGRNSATSHYYALDVTDKMNPKFMWSVDSSVLPGLGQAWAAPQIARVNVGGATQNSQKLVLVVSGGYDPVEDNYSYVNADSVGNRIYFVDALRGTLLWAAGPAAATGINFVAPRMDHSIPSAVTVMDMDGDGYADRMYVGDMAAQLWRFDIWNGQPAETLATGGVIASLGAKYETTRTLAAARRFYSAPDVTAVQKAGTTPFLNIAMGSGYRGHPLDTATHDRFYSIRDDTPFAKLTQLQYDTRPIAVDAHSSSLLPLVVKPVDITTLVQPTIASDAAGWQLAMNQHGGWVGEKVLSGSRTFNNDIIFTSYTPASGAGVSAPCQGVGTGANRVYAVSVNDGSPVLDKNKDGIEQLDERSQDLSQGGIAPEAAFLFPGPDDSGSGGGGGGSGTGQVVCLSGVEVLSVCSSFEQRRKTYWREGGAN